jgi:hypothetical protein
MKNLYQLTYAAVTRILSSALNDKALPKEVRADRQVHMAILEAMRPAIDREDAATAVYGLAIALATIVGSIDEEAGREALIKEFETIVRDRADGLNKITGRALGAARELCACQTASASGVTLN